jgi:hypothetical protein
MQMNTGVRSFRAWAVIIPYWFVSTEQLRHNCFGGFERYVFIQSTLHSAVWSHFSMKCYLECLVVFVCLSVLPLSVELSEAPGIFLQQLSVVYFFPFLFTGSALAWRWDWNQCPLYCGPGGVGLIWMLWLASFGPSHRCPWLTRVHWLGQRKYGWVLFSSQWDYPLPSMYHPFWDEYM